MSAGSQQLRLLYVDDDADIRTVTLLALGLDKGIDVRGVASGEEALAVLRKAGWVADAVLLDVMMHGMSGPALVAAIREADDIAALPIIFMTARASRAAICEYHALGAVGVIAKPFDPLRLAAEVRALIGRPARAAEDAATTAS